MVTCSFIGNLGITDNTTGGLSLSEPVNIQFVGSVATYTSTTNFGTSPTSVTLPVSPVQFAVIINKSTTATATITWTPTGGASNPVATLQPGSGLFLIENNTTSGITALSITANTAATPIFYVLAG